MKSAILKNGIVENIIVGSVEGSVDVTDKQCGIGWSYDGTDFHPVPSAPESITALQGLLSIDFSGLSSEYESWANSPDRTFSQKAFISKAMVWRRDDPTLNAAATALGIDSANLDHLFNLASTL